jgi:predicted nucleic acid-binding protein
MHPSTICVDAGIVIRRILFPEDIKLHQLWTEWNQNNNQIFAPTLLPFEIINVLYRYQRQGMFSPDTSNLAIQTALALPIELSHSKDLHTNAFRLAQKFDLSAAYDAHYLALAEMLGAEFWTVDKQLYNTLEKYRLDWVKTIL